MKTIRLIITAIIFLSVIQVILAEETTKTYDETVVVTVNKIKEEVDLSDLQYQALLEKTKEYFDRKEEAKQKPDDESTELLQEIEVFYQNAKDSILSNIKEKEEPKFILK